MTAALSASRSDHCRVVSQWNPATIEASGDEKKCAPTCEGLLRRECPAGCKSPADAGADCVGRNDYARPFCAAANFIA
jgi:hypothetical protein